MSLGFEPKTRLEKILCGVATVAKTRLEKAVKHAVDNAGGGGSGGNGAMVVHLTPAENQYVADKTLAEIFEAFSNDIPVFILNKGDMMRVRTCEEDDGDYEIYASVMFIDGGTVVEHYAEWREGSGGFAWNTSWRTVEPFEHVFKVTGTFGTDGSNKTTITLDKSAESCYDAVAAGKAVLMKSYADENAVEEVVRLSAKRIWGNDGYAGYQFYLTNESGTGFASAVLNGGDTLVVTETGN